MDYRKWTEETDTQVLFAKFVEEVGEVGEAYLAWLRDPNPETVSNLVAETLHVRFITTRLDDQVLAQD